MAFTIEDRLSRLKSRRFDDQNTSLSNRGYVESFQNRTQNKASQYALGAMQEVDRRSTEISNEEADKVKNALEKRLINHGLWPQFRLQGSVTTNTHIRGKSDVDLLEVHGRYMTYAPYGRKANIYVPMSSGTSVVTEVLKMRRISEDELKTHFWGATIDTGNAKSIQPSDGGFRRKVDVVPSHWFDSVDYQHYETETFRGVTVVDKFTQETNDNFPFLFQAKIEEKASATNDGAKMSIRLSKNVNSDLEDASSLSSYDISSFIFHCPNDYIRQQPARDLSILAGTESWFRSLVQNRSYAEQLKSPDDTRKILDQPSKWNGLVALSNGLTALAEEVHRELVAPYTFFSDDLSSINRSLNESNIPLMPSY